MNHSYWTYIVGSRSGTLYIGLTSNLERRIWEHKAGGIDGFARKYHCERLVYYEAFDQFLDAIAREKQLKGWRREEDRIDRVTQSSMGGCGREVGREDGIRRRVGSGKMSRW